MSQSNEIAFRARHFIRAPSTRKTKIEHRRYDIAASEHCIAVCLLFKIVAGNVSDFRHCGSNFIPFVSVLDFAMGSPFHSLSWPQIAQVDMFWWVYALIMRFSFQANTKPYRNCKCERHLKLRKERNEGRMKEGDALSTIKCPL